MKTDLTQIVVNLIMISIIALAAMGATYLILNDNGVYEDREIVFKLKDERTVTCVRYERALSCDWENAK